MQRLEEAKKRDHNKLGREMELFTTVDVIGQGLPLNSEIARRAIIQTLQRWIEDEEEKRGYIRTKTPLMAKKDLYVISDHWNHYKEGMFVLGDEEKDDEVFGPASHDLSLPVLRIQGHPAQLPGTAPALRRDFHAVSE